MPNVRALVLRSPGTNCDAETEHAFRLAGAFAERIHVQRVLEAPAMLEQFQIVCFPGGFSYGDDLGAGKLLAHVVQQHLRLALEGFRDRGGIILGICNGFQVLLKTGLLIEPDPATRLPRATLAFNRHGRFEDRWVYLQLTPGRCAFLQGEERIELPIAHAEGNFTAADPVLLDELTAQGRVFARYVDAAGQPGDYPINPNGSQGAIAGICDWTGRVAALMPHPERHVEAYQHPRWTRRRAQPAEGDGLRFFRCAVQACQ